MTSMFCKYCGKELPDNSKFCRFCGNKLLNNQPDEDLPKKKNEAITYAGFWIRLGAYLIDLLGWYTLTFLTGIIYGLLISNDMSDGLSYLLTYFSYVIYNTFCLSIWSTTLGKYLYGLRIVTVDNKDLLFRQALKRSLLQPLSTFFFGIGFWNLDKNDKKQAWHDKQTDTVVVRKKKGLFFAYILTIIGVIAWIYSYSLGMGE